MRNWLAAALILVAPVALAEESTSQIASMCIVEIDGAAFMDGPCEISPSDELGSVEMKRNGFFVSISAESDSQAEGYWNGVTREAHAHEPLGTLRWDGECWSNDKNRACFYP